MSLSARATSFASLCLFPLVFGPVACAANADLSLVLSASSSPARAGEPLTYTLSVTNKAVSTAKKLVLVNPLPAGVPSILAPSGCRIATAPAKVGPRLICKAKRLTAGNSMAWSYVVQPGAAGELVNTATVGSGKRDANPADNSVSLSITVLPADAEASSPTSSPSTAGKQSPILSMTGGNSTPVQVETRIAMPDQAANALRELSPALLAGELDAIATANRKLAFDLYAIYRFDTTGNYVFSTVDMARSLAMLAPGAAGDTLSAILGATDIDLGEDRLHPAMNAAALDLADRNRASRLALDTALWGQGVSSGHAQSFYLFETQFLDTLENSYGPATTAVDFTAPTDPAQNPVGPINQWIAAHTHADGPVHVAPLSERVRLVAASVLSLEGAWQTPPDADPAPAGRFELLDGTQVLVPMPAFSGQFAYAEGDGYRAFELPLAGGDLALSVVMPDHGRFAEFQAAFDFERLDGILAAMAPRRTTLYLPRIQIASGFPGGLLPALQQGGVFTEGQADFSRVNGEGYLFLDALVHGSRVSLGEEGAQADGVTVTVHRAGKDESGSVWSGGSVTTMTGCGQVPHYDPSLALARPFLFAIRDRATGSILFMGQLTAPGGESAPPDWTENTCPTPVQVQP